MTKEKDVFKVSKNIVKSIEQIILSESGAENLFQAYRIKGFSSINSEIANTSDMLIFNFEFKGEKRNLHVHFDCDSDGKQCGYADGSKLILSFGMWGSSIQLMRGILEGLKVFGKCYLIGNDCADYEWKNCKI
jgi:hypothetical protein